jgi:hypothetical protein
MTVYKYLEQGERFRFIYGFGKQGEHVHTKAAGRFYVCGLTGRRFTTGARVTVQREVS